MRGFQERFMGICVAVGSILILVDSGVDLGAAGAVGVGMISYVIGVTVAAIVNRGEGR